MSKENYAVVEVYRGEYRQGFKTRDDAVAYVHRRFDDIVSGAVDDPIGRDDDYEFRVVQVLDEWSSTDLLPGER